MFELLLDAALGHCKDKLDILLFAETIEFWFLEACKDRLETLLKAEFAEFKAPDVFTLPLEAALDA